MKRRTESRIVDPAKHPTRYVSMVVAAEYLSITRKTLGEWLDEGRLRYYKFGARRRLLVTDLVEFERKAQRSTRN